MKKTKSSNPKKKFLLVQFYLYPYHKKVMKALDDKYDFYYIDRFGVYDKKHDNFRFSYTSTFSEKIKMIFSMFKSLHWTYKNRKSIHTVFGLTEVNWFAWLFFKAAGQKTQKILFPTEVVYFRKASKQKYSKIDLFFEKKNFFLADKLMHKGINGEFKYLPYYKKVKSKPLMKFREYFDETIVQKYNPKIKLSKKDGEIHVVFVGGLYEESRSYCDSAYELIPKITKQKIHLHIYSNAPPTMKKRFNQIQKKDKYFHFEGLVPHSKLMKELPKYDYGYYLHIWNRDNFNNNYYMWNTFGNRVFDYLSSKIPMLCTTDAKVIAEFNSEYKSGLSIKSSDMKNLRKILEKDVKKYDEYIKNIDKAIKQLSNHSKFVEFIDKKRRRT